MLDDGPPCHKALLPFVQSFDFTLLAAALRKRPLLYFNPAVHAQIVHLLRLRDNEEEWERVWDAHVDDVLGIATPSEVERVEDILRQLASAHVSALLTDMTIAPERPPKEPGRKGGFDNPYPRSETTRISPKMLHAAWRRLRERFSSPYAKKRLGKVLAQPPADHVGRVVALARDILNDDDPLYWSALVERVSNGEPPPPGLSDDEHHFWLEYREPSELHTTVDLTPLITDALSPAHRERMRKAGVAGFLASAVLAAHLGDVTTEQVQRAVEHYRRKYRRGE